MHIQQFAAAVLVGLAVSAQALPAKRDLPGQSLRLDATQVELACITQLSTLCSRPSSLLQHLVQLDVLSLFSAWAVQHVKNYTGQVTLSPCVLVRSMCDLTDKFPRCSNTGVSGAPANLSDKSELYCPTQF